MKKIMLLYQAISCGLRKLHILVLLLCTLSIYAEYKKAMNILMVVGRFPVIHDVCILNEITGLIKRGHNVTIFAFNKGDCVNVQEDVISYDLINKTIFKNFPTNLNEYDIIAFQVGHRIFDIKEKYKFKGKVAAYFRGYDITAFLHNNPHFYDKSFDYCDLFLPVCNAFKKILEQEGCSSHKIVVHHSSIDCSKFTFSPNKMPHDGPINIVSAGRFVEKKGFKYVIKAIAHLVKKYPRIHFTLLGQGPLKEEYESLINLLGITRNVTIDSWRAHGEYIKFLDKSHVFIIPSIIAENNDQEGIPNVAKEAMAKGVLVVATDHSGNPELIEDGVSGLLVPEANSDAIAKAVEYLLQHPQKWFLMQLAAVNKVHKEFDKERENDKLEAIFYRLLDK